MIYAKFSEIRENKTCFGLPFSVFQPRTPNSKHSIMKKHIPKKLLLLSFSGLLLFASYGFRTDFFEIAKQIEIFTTLFKELNMNYVDETNPAELMDAAITGMLEDLDPYTHYWNEQDVETARINNSGEYTGIGATVAIRENHIIIVEPYKDYPADKAGLKAGDEITKIDDVVVADFEENAGELLKGAPNSKVLITYRRQGHTTTTTLTRGAVEIKAVPFYKLLKDGTGYIVLSQFNRNASSETTQALKELKEEGATRIILDLRGNPGGLLSEAINVSNIFVPEGELITTTKSVVEKYNKAYHTTRKAIDTEIPLAVLIDGRSASASDMRATPSSVARPYSARKLSMRPRRLPLRTVVTRASAWAEMACRAAGSRPVAAMREWTRVVSSARFWLRRVLRMVVMSVMAIPWLVPPAGSFRHRPESILR